MKQFASLCSLFLIASLANSALAGAAQAQQSNLTLQAEIESMDRLLFDEAFNRCDLALYKTLTSNDFEFYDDRSGLNKSIDKEILSFEDRCARPFAVTRQLVSSSVYGLAHYGAFQIGEHEFYEDAKKVERAKFITIWGRDKDSWIVRRAISYAHRGVEGAAEDQQVDDELQAEIDSMDRRLFDEAFNGCDLQLYRTVLTEDFEFYDDRTGLNKSIDKEIMSFEDRCSRPFAVTRKLVSSTAYGLGDYGALQIGEHEFYEDDKRAERAKFIIVWERASDAWLMRRVVSYAHQGVESASSESYQLGF